MQDILISWSKVKGNAEQTNIGKEIIWNNSKIKVQNKTLFNKKWFERGIQYIEHIYDYRKKDFYCFKDFIDLYDLPQKYFYYITQLFRVFQKIGN